MAESNGTDSLRHAGLSEIVRRAQDGDVDAFHALYNENAGRVYALCLRLSGGDDVDASALMQDVFIKVWRGLSTFRGDSAFSSWLHRLAVTTLLQNVRADKRRMARVLPMEDPARIEKAPETESPEGRMDIEAAVASLPKGARVAFVMHEIEGLHHEEIAEQLGIAVGTVKSQLHRARKLLREKLEL